MRVVQTELNDFLQKYGKSVPDLEKLGVFSEADFAKISKEFGLLGTKDKILHLLTNELLLAIINPLKVITNFSRIVREQLAGWRKHNENTQRSLGQQYPISDYANKAAVISCFEPKSILEIGTWYGWGISAIKAVNPDAICYSMNPEITETANNPIKKEDIGYFYREKELDVKQIWADSTQFDYATLPEIDVCYIDGNHKYEYVKQDLANSAKLVKKAVVLDDYIPTADSPRGDVLMWGWNNVDVVKAVDEFLENDNNTFTQAFWIINTPICVLIK